MLPQQLKFAGHVFDGNFWHTIDDLSVPGRGVPLDFSQTYNSSAVSTDGPLGFGWTDNYAMSLSFGGSGDVTVNEEGGSGGDLQSVWCGLCRSGPSHHGHTGEESGRHIHVHSSHEHRSLISRVGQLIDERDLNGYTTTLSYNGSGNVSTVTDPAGRQLTFTWTGDNITQITDPIGRTVEFTYDSAGDLTDITDVSGGDTHFTYYSGHLLWTMRMPDQNPAAGGDGNALTNVYNSADQVTSQTDAMGRSTTFSYVGDPSSDSGGTTTVTDPDGDVSEYLFVYGELVR